MPFCVFAHGVTQKRPNFFSPINDTLCFPTEKEADKEVLIHARRFDTDPAYFFVSGFISDMKCFQSKISCAIYTKTV